MDLRCATVEDIEDEYWSWHGEQEWLPASDPAIFRPVAEFSEGEGIDATHN